MIAELGNYLGVYFSSMFKFVAGPVIGAAKGLTFAETIIFTVLGMMTTVLVISFFGSKLRALWLGYFGKKEKKIFTRRNRRFIHIWRKYGEFGISFLTPVIFSPVIGTLVITTLGGKKKKIISYMFFSATFWACALFFLGESLLRIFSPFF